MKIKVDFYRDSGKWYANCELDLPKELAYTQKQAEGFILDNQNAIIDHKGYYMVVTDLCDSDPFFMRLYDYTKLDDLSSSQKEREEK